MPSIAEPVVIPKRVTKKRTRTDADLAPTYYVICWNDPVNLMNYVTHVFMKVFGWNKQKAEKHMMEVHDKGKSVLIREGAEKAEFYVHQLHNYKLHATMEPAE
jgi:ATP-dependent Clp protease adaptor protein ClpS